MLDLLSEADIGALLAEAHRVLVPQGRLCVASLTVGEKPLARVVSGAWSLVHRARPAFLGGGRPVIVRDILPARHWRNIHRSVVAAFAVSSEVVVAERSTEPAKSTMMQ